MITVAASTPLVLDEDAFSSPDALRDAYIPLARPVLLRVREASAQSAANWARPDDTLCLLSTPAPLVAHQLEQLRRACVVPLDNLTGLSHRKQLLDTLTRSLPMVSEAHPLSILLMDIDHFKSINDEHGHKTGDLILRELAELLERRCDQAELITRFGGEQLTILVKGDEKHAVDLAETLRRAIAAQEFQGSVHLTVSIGVAVAEEPTPQGNLLRQVEEAMYAAKAGGRDQVLCYQALEREARQRDEDMAFTSFENLTRVAADRIAATITRRGRRLFEEMKRQADVDALTGLYSRRYLDRRLANDHQAAAGTRTPLSISLIDIDFFGAVNKEHGWPTGDSVLVELSRVVRDSVRGNDWVGRYGGEELCLVMPQTGLDDARSVLERIRRNVETHVFLSTSDVPISLTVSAGVAELDENDRDLEQLIERVSERLLVAKRGGRNKVC